MSSIGQKILGGAFSLLPENRKSSANRSTKCLQDSLELVRSYPETLGNGRFEWDMRTPGRTDVPKTQWPGVRLTCGQDLTDMRISYFDDKGLVVGFNIKDPRNRFHTSNTKTEREPTGYGTGPGLPFSREEWILIQGITDSVRENIFSPIGNPRFIPDVAVNS